MKAEEGIHIKDKYGNEIKLDSSAGTITIHSPTHEFENGFWRKA